MTMKTNITKFCARAAATLAFPLKRLPVALLMLLTTTTARAWLTDFVAVSQQGTATARFAFSDHFYRVDWSGINTSETSSVQLCYNSNDGSLKAYRNGNTSSTTTLFASASLTDYWKTSHITGLTPGQSSDGYTNYEKLATGASYPSVFKKVCTVTCLSATPTWAWSADRSACTATFTCAEDASLTATVTATVTAAGGSITASATFNGTAYTDTKTDPWGRSDGRDGSEANPYAIGSPEALALLSTYVNAGNNASGLHFEQTQDIDMSSAGRSAEGRSQGENFTPIGSKANDFNPTPFNGTYGGTGYYAGTITLGAATKTGYTFDGWYRSADLSGDAVTTIGGGQTGDVELWAKWTANRYAIAFDGNGATGGTMYNELFDYDEAKALTACTYTRTGYHFTGWNTERDGSGTSYEDETKVQNLTAEQGGTVTLYAQWRLQHRFNYDEGIFRCYNAANSNEVYWAYAGETVKVEVCDGSSEYTIYVTAEDGTAIAFDTETSTFTMPDQEVYVTSTSVKKMAYTTILLDDFDAWTDVVYLYDASQPTVTPTVTVMDGETVLTEGTDYTLEITNNTGSATQMVTATGTVTGKGGYVGTTTQTFRITPFNIANCEIRGTLEAYDDGYGVYYPLSENVEVWNGETQLTLDTDYSLSIADADSYEVGHFYNATVKGTGDWGGSKTFQFQVVELKHTVVFDANGGTGTMASDVATKGQHYTLPECAFTAPDGKKFSHWVASCEPDEEKQPGDYFTAPYIWSENDVVTITVTAYWRECETVSVTLAPAGYGTYYDSTNDIILPTGIKARIVTNNDGYGSLTYQTIADGDNLASNVIPAGTAVMLQTAPTAEPQQHVLILSSKSADRYEGENLLHGSDEATTTYGGSLYYKLTYGSQNGHEDLFGWYWGAENGAAFISPAHKVWLALSDYDPGEGQGGAEDGRRFINLPEWEEASGIRSLSKESRSEGVWYTLEGKRLSGQPAAKGLYINNGRKVVIR